MDQAPIPEEFSHVRVIIGIVTGLCVTRLLTGLARFVQHPSRTAIYPLHLGWAVFLLLAVMHFWWFEFGLGQIRVWTFQLYFFLVLYASLYFFACTLLFPDSLEEYRGFADYFHSRQQWFYGLLAAIFLLDMADSAAKGPEHFHALGASYPIRQTVLAALALVAVFVRRGPFHIGFLAVALVAEVWWILSSFDLLGRT